MANILDDLASKLQTAGKGTVGTNIFKGEMPDTPDNCVALYETGGYPPEIVATIDYPTFQVRTRNTDYSTGRAKAQEISDVLHGLTETTLGTTHYLLIRAMQAPASIGRDEKKRWEFTQNYKIIMRR
jgi:hypothetical protein